MEGKLKYGENPHQKATFRTINADDPLAISKFKRSDGGAFLSDETSWISITDLGRLIATAERFAAAFKKNVGGPPPSLAVIVKHGSPCGAAYGEDPATVVRSAWLGDPQAAFGGFLLSTFPFTRAVADSIKDANGGRMPFLSVAAPSIEKEIENYVGTKANTRYFVSNPALAEVIKPAIYKETTSVRDVVLEQDSSQFIPDFKNLSRHGSALASGEENRILADLSLAFAICASSTSNTISIVKNGTLIANAVGQQKRVGSAKLALALAKENGHDAAASVAVSDSFFPFPDGLESLAKGGVSVVFATSGSMRDEDVFNAAERLNITMFTAPDKEGRMFAGH